MMIDRRWLVSAGLALHIGTAWASVESGLHTKLTLEVLDDADLGTASGGDLSAAAVDIKPWAYWQTTDWRAYGMAEAFIASDTIEYESSSADPVSDGFVGVREVWMDYTGLTAYPGEYLRTGLQRVRTADGLWWDTDIEAVKWVFDTTLLHAEAGVAERYRLYRSDQHALSYEDEDRRHLFVLGRYQWVPGHWLALRMHQRQDSSDASVMHFSAVDGNNRYDALRWFSLETDSDFYNVKNTAFFNYALGAVRLQESHQQRDVLSKTKKIDAQAFDALLRVRVDTWQFGAAASWSSGGIDSGDGQYLQTGLESNRSAYTGTRTRCLRYGEAFRGKLGNLQVLSLFVSWLPSETWDTSLALHQFKKADAAGDVSSAIVLPTKADEKDLGQELDIIVTRYMTQSSLLPEWVLEESAFVRLRTGIFSVGDAYGNEADSQLFHVTGELVWMF